MSEIRDIISIDGKRESNIKDSTIFKQFLDSLNYSKGLNSLIALNKFDIKIFAIDNIISKSVLLPLNIINIEKLQIYYSEKNEKEKPLYSYNTLQKEEVEYKMIYNPNYVPSEREFYSQLTPKEKREWDSLCPEDKQFNLELMGPAGERIFEKLESLDDKIRNLTLFGI